MRTIVFLMFIFLINDIAWSQDHPLPSQKQVQAQAKQARTEAQQQIIDSENEIAEARKNNVDPEEIKEMEKNLATLKKMLGVLDKVATTNRTPPKEIPKANTIAPYKSPYIRFFTQPITIPTEAQAKDRLLWYRGKKIDKNTLITMNGRVIKYDRQNNRVLVQYNEKKDTTPLKIIANLKKSRQWTNNYVNNESARKNSFFDYPLVMMVMKEFDLIEQDFNKLADNTIPLPGTGDNLMAKIKPGYLNEKNISGPNVIYEINVSDSLDPDEWVRQAHQELLNLMNHPPPLDFAPPPKHEFDLCYYCDTSLQGKYYRDKSEWGDKFTEYEAKLISKGFEIDRQYQLFGSDISQSNIPNLEQDIEKAQEFAFKRLNQKIELLKQRYSNDVFRQEAVVTEILTIERDRQLLGYGDENSVMPEFDFLNLFGGYLEQRIQARDYNVVFNYCIILGHERQGQLLGVTPEETGTDLMEEVWKLNRFALTLNIDFDIQYEPEEGKPNLKADGHLSTTEKIYVKLGRTEDCKWQLYKYDPDYGSTFTRNQETLFKIPMTVNSGTKQVLKGDHWVSYPYTGPKDLEMNFPLVRISFCPNSGSDSATMDILRYKQENVSGDVSEAYAADLLGYLDKVLVSISDTKENKNEVLDIIGQMTTLPNQATVDNPTGYGKLDKMQVDYKLNGIQHDLQKKTTETTKVNNTVILFDAQNGDQFLINGKINTAHRELNVIKLNSGLIQLKVVLEPL